MSWTNRDGLNIIPSANEIGYIDINQNIEARMALSRSKATIIGGQGIYSGGARQFSDLKNGATEYPSCIICLFDDQREAFWFSTTQKDIDYQISSGVGYLYAVINLEDFVLPDSADPSEDAVSFVVLSEDDTAPLYSLKIGKGNVSSSVFSNFSGESSIFKGSGYNLWSWEFNVNSLNSTLKAIEDGSVFLFDGSSGIKTNATTLDTIEINANLKSDGGIYSVSDQLAIKLKSGGGLAVDADGIYVDSLPLNAFFLVADSGVSQELAIGDKLILRGNGAVKTSISDSNEATISLELGSGFENTSGSDEDFDAAIMSNDGVLTDELDQISSGGDGLTGTELMGGFWISSEDAFYFGSTDPFGKINFSMGTVKNSNETTISVYYWNGSAWSSLTVDDQTSEASVSLSRSEIVSWSPQTDWQTAVKSSTLFGVDAPGTVVSTALYWVKITFSNDLSGQVGVLLTSRVLDGLSLKLSADNQLEKNAYGLALIPAEFSIVADSGDNKTLTQDEEFTFSGYQALNTTVSSNTVTLAVDLASDGGLEELVNQLVVKRKSGGQMGSGTDSLRAEPYIIDGYVSPIPYPGYYGYPSSGMTTGEIFRDKSGASFVATSASTATQLSIGECTELPDKTEFYGGTILAGYSIRVFDDNDFIWTWAVRQNMTFVGFWVSDYVMPITLEPAIEFSDDRVFYGQPGVGGEAFVTSTIDPVSFYEILNSYDGIYISDISTKLELELYSDPLGQITLDSTVATLSYQFDDIEEKQWVLSDGIASESSMIIGSYKDSPFISSRLILKFSINGTATGANPSEIVAGYANGKVLATLNIRYIKDPDGVLGYGEDDFHIYPVPDLILFENVQLFGIGGNLFNAVIDENGWVFTSGDNTYGELGNQTTTDTNSYVLVVGGHSFTQLSVGATFAAGLKSNGTVWAWGNNASGQLGDETTDSKSSPISVVGAHSFVSLAAGTTHIIGLKEDGSVWGWGDNASGELGDETINAQSSPISVVGEHSFISISAGGSYNLASKEDGTVWAWGLNSSGQLGDETTASKSSPISIAYAPPNTSWVEMNVSQNVISLLDSDGYVWNWGYNYAGHLMLESTYSFVSIPAVRSYFHSITQSFQTIVPRDYATAALDTNGKIWGWGVGNYIGAGEGLPTAVSSPTIAIGQTNKTFTKLGQKCLVGCSLRDNGKVYLWSTFSSSGYQTGYSYIDARYNSVQEFESFETGYYRIYSLDSDGICWYYGTRTADGGSDLTSPIALYPNLFSFIQVSGISTHGVGLKANGTAWSWGLTSSTPSLEGNYYGQMGDGTTTVKSSPVSVVGNHSFISVSTGNTHTLALKADGSVWAWGQTPLGDNTMISRSSPVSVVGNHSFIKIIASYLDSYAIKADGTVWAWGSNNYGQLGDGTTSYKLSPVAVLGGAHSFIDLVFCQATDAYQTVAALKENGEIWVWGSNAHYQCAPSGFSTNTSPIQVIGGHSFIEIGSNRRSGTFYGLKEDGMVWAWGQTNNNAIRGKNYADIPDVSSPVQVVTYQDYDQISGCAGRKREDSTIVIFGGLGYCEYTATSDSYFPSMFDYDYSFVDIVGFSYGGFCALSGDGTLWQWGYNQYGEIANPSVAVGSGTSSPVSVVGAHSFIKITSNNQWGFAALKENGTVWCWGLNGGSVGDGTNITRSSPVSVIGAHSFVDIFSGDICTFGLKDDGTLWGWGFNDIGQLADGTNINRSSPVSVIGDHSFIDVNIRFYSTYARKEDGTVWAWGSNTYGFLADGTTVLKSSPVLVNIALNQNTPEQLVASDTHSILLTAEGEIWSWGDNTNGQLGNETVDAKSSPISVVGDHAFSSISSGSNFSAGLKSDGSIWAWGDNTSGQLGNNSFTSESSPISVIGNHSFSQFYCASAFCSGLKVDKSLWVWGDNASGQLGDGSTSDKVSPIKIIGYS